MLTHLSIQNYAIVEHLDLELHAGMTAITGETGAGKSIMLDALGLCLGDRCDSTVVRAGSTKADILASFDISHIPEASAWLAQNDLLDESNCLLRRVINQDGRSRAYINGTPCPLSHLKSLGELLIDIHSQHEHQSLLKSDTHRRLLDEYAGIKQQAAEVKNLALSWRQTQQKLQQLTNTSEEQQAKQQLLQYQLDELTELALSGNEVEQLEVEQQTLYNADAILAACQTTIDLCTDDQASILTTLKHCIRNLTSFKVPQTDLIEVINLLSSAQIQIEEAVNEVNQFIGHFEANPERLQQVDSRLDRIYSLARKHHIQANELPTLMHDLAQELAATIKTDESVAQLNQQLENLHQKYQLESDKLSKLRQKAAVALSQAVQREIQSLGMPGGQFSVQLTPNNSGEPQPFGLENIEFLVSSNAGQPLKPLNKVASGGELSRISLAIQVITAKTSRVSTLVFDEVDVGIGGPTAEIVGQLLRQLGKQGQVIAVTHLAQVAAQGHQHLFVHKEQVNHATVTAITLLNKKQRIEELARMLGGIDLTKESIAHAQKMYTQAQAD